ncbi:hypothetical protein, partial [Halomonas llamarensis]
VRLRNIAHAQRRRAHHAAALALEGHITRLSDACPDVVNGSLTFRDAKQLMRRKTWHTCSMPLPLDLI